MTTLVKKESNLRNNKVYSIIGRIALIGSPLLFLLSELLHPVTQTETALELASVAANYDKWYIAHILALGAIILLPFAVLFLLYMLREHNLVINYVGTSLSLIGIVAVSGLTSFDLIVWQMGKGGPTDAMVKLFDQITQSLGFSIPFLTIGPLLLVIGLLLLSVALYKTKVVARWQALLLGLGIFLYGFAGPVVPIKNGHLIVLLGAALMLIGLGSVGIGLKVSKSSFQK